MGDAPVEIIAAPTIRIAPRNSHVGVGRTRQRRVVGFFGSALVHMSGVALAMHPEWFGLPRWELRVPRGKNAPALIASVPQPRREAAETIRLPPTEIAADIAPPERREAESPDRPAAAFAAVEIDRRVPLPEDEARPATADEPQPRPLAASSPPKQVSEARRLPRDEMEQIESPASAPSEASSGAESAAPPELVRDARPIYPAAAQAAGQQGVVKLYVRVDDEGRVVDAAVAVSSGYPLLDAAALEAIYRAQFARVGGRRGVALEFIKPVVFRLGR